MINWLQNFVSWNSVSSSTKRILDTRSSNFAFCGRLIFKISKGSPKIASKLLYEINQNSRRVDASGLKPV